MDDKKRLITVFIEIFVAVSVLVLFVAINVAGAAEPATATVVVDTGQVHCYDASGPVDCGTGDFSGQDAQYRSATPSYLDHGDGTVTDRQTGLMWQKDPGAKQTYRQAIAGAQSSRLAGYSDWRVPTIKELYSLIDFRGVDPSPGSRASAGPRPFIDAETFAFAYGDSRAGERLIDSQWVTSTIYQSTVMGGEECFFGVNFADGRIKCYPTRRGKDYYAIYVRGARYGDNVFVDPRDGTLVDESTGLVWQQADPGTGVDWRGALAYCEDLELAGKDDWRLPSAKELQSIVDYSRSPETTGSAAIDPLFSTSSIVNEAGQRDYPFFWTSTTHVNERSAGHAVYVAFGRAMGYMRGRWLDVHGAGAQRSDPKAGSPADFAQGHGPQGDARRVLNAVRCVRGGAEPSPGEPASTARPTMPATKLAELGDRQGETPGDRPTAGRQARGRRSPPPEAVDACHGLSDGASCSFTAPHGTVRGACRDLDETKTACVPSRQRPPRRVG